MSVEKPRIDGKQTRHKGSEYTANAVNRTCTHRVVYVELGVDEFYREYENHTANQAYHDGSERRNEVAAGCNAHKTGEHAVEHERERGFAIFYPCGEHGCNTARCGSKVGGKKHVRHGRAVDFARSGELRTGVETEPAEPKDEHSESSDEQVMAGNGVALAVFVVLAETRTETESTYKREHTAYGVYYRRTGEVVERSAECRHHKTSGIAVAKPAAAPRPVAAHRINQHGYEQGVNAIHGELGALSHSTAHNRCTRCAEHSLEYEESFNGKPVIEERYIAEIGRSDKPFAIVAEHKAEAYKPEKQRTEHEVHEILEQDVRRIFSARETRLAKGETRLHEEHQHCRKQHPYCI